MHHLIVILGATGVGKTDLSIRLARIFNAPIISSDSRQIYRQMRIGTAVPTDEQLREAVHYFIQCKDITESYTSGRYENDVLALLDRLYETNDYVILSGGSGLYISAVCQGIDGVPGTNKVLRERLKKIYESRGILPLLQRLKQLDPEYYEKVDHKNHQRIFRALEVCIETGKPYSCFRTGQSKKRNFNIIYIGLSIPRDQLYQRINSRVDRMMEEGLEAEARRLYPYKGLNALQTVGYKELFDYMDGKCSLPEAVELIKRNTRRYAKRQITWFSRLENVYWTAPDHLETIVAHIKRMSLIKQSKNCY